MNWLSGRNVGASGHLVVPGSSVRYRYELTNTTTLRVATCGFEAALVMDEHKAAGSILLAAGRMPQRERYSLAHEPGHFLLPSHQPTAAHSFQCSLADFRLMDERERNQRVRIEAEANRFAARLLMPLVSVRKQIGQSDASLQGIVAMSRNFEVRKEAMA